MDAEFLALLAETREARAILLTTLAELTRMLDDRPSSLAKPVERSSAAAKPSGGSALLLMTEGLVEAHKAAVIDGDGYSLDLIEDALRYVGERLSRECAEGRSLRRQRLGHE